MPAPHLYGIADASFETRRRHLTTKNKHHCSFAFAILQPQVFHGGRFGVLGTPPSKPLKCKFKLNSIGDIAVTAGSSVSLCEGLPAILIESTSAQFVISFRFVPFPFGCPGYSNKKALPPSGKQGSKKSGNAPIRLPPVRMFHYGNRVPLSTKSKDIGKTSNHRPADSGLALR